MRVSGKLILASVAALACTNNLTSVEDGVLKAVVTKDSVFVTNNLDEPLYLSLVDYDDLPTLNLQQCLTRQECGPGLAGAATHRESLRDIPGGADGVIRVSLASWIFRTSTAGADSLVVTSQYLIIVPK